MCISDSTLADALTWDKRARIALIDGAKNTEEGKKFIAFTLSQAGQELLLEPKISRLPVLPYSALAGKVPQGYPDPAEIARRSKVQFLSLIHI